MTYPNEVRNPRYAGATIGDLVRALIRPRKPKEGKPSEEGQPGPTADRSGQVLFQRDNSTPDRRK